MEYILQIILTTQRNGLVVKPSLYFSLLIKCAEVSSLRFKFSVNSHDIHMAEDVVSHIVIPSLEWLLSLLNLHIRSRASSSVFCC